MSNQVITKHCVGDQINEVFDSGFIDELKVLASTSTTSTKEITERLTSGIEAYLAANGWRVTREIPVGLYRSGINKVGKEYRFEGYIDLFAEKGDRTLAIEIDRSNKTWSYMKLEHCATNLNSMALWVRWRGRVNKKTNNLVAVCDVSPKTR